MKKLAFLVAGVLTALQINAATVDPQVQLLNQQMTLLQNMYAPTSVKALVNTYAAAVQQRNGAVQYSLLCSDLQAQRLANFQANNWVTGTSSPSVSSYTIRNTGHNHFRITYAMTLQGQPGGKMVEDISVMPVTPNPAVLLTQHYCIDQDKLTAGANS
jgi:hypothetical protein